VSPTVPSLSGRRPAAISLRRRAKPRSAPTEELLAVGHRRGRLGQEVPHPSGPSVRPYRQSGDDRIVTLRPLLITRITCTFPGVVGLVFASALLAGSESVPDVMLSVAAVLAAAVVAVRGYRLGVVCGDGRVVVRGLLWSRSVSADRVVEVTPFPALRWEAVNGRTRWTPITAFLSSGRQLPFVTRHSEHCVDQLERWLFQGRPRRPGRRT
jgi:hypothetical protein